eukprot:gene15239-biopygen13498
MQCARVLMRWCSVEVPTPLVAGLLPVAPSGYGRAATSSMGKTGVPGVGRHSRSRCPLLRSRPLRGFASGAARPPLLTADRARGGGALPSPADLPRHTAGDGMGGEMGGEMVARLKGML